MSKRRAGIASAAAEPAHDAPLNVKLEGKGKGKGPLRAAVGGK